MKPKVIRVTQSTNLTPAGQPDIQYTIQFTVGEMGPFTVQVPGKDFNAAAAQKAMDQLAGEISKLTPQEK